ncbi:predicted protein [Botrytis cinerea T4]|uniref:Uncharacterized protein n=1 Tax=Botryotinia fuckeliana (strain T4) TaxID=999810 RepID=G2YSH2_BOTF4|nr:predicted protein [Botrytis cinerea T4]
MCELDYEGRSIFVPSFPTTFASKLIECPFLRSDVSHHRKTYEIRDPGINHTGEYTSPDTCAVVKHYTDRHMQVIRWHFYLPQDLFQG